MSKSNSGKVSREEFYGLVLARLDAIEQLLATWVPQVTKLLAIVVKDQEDLDKRVTKLEGESAA